MLTDLAKLYVAFLAFGLLCTMAGAALVLAFELVYDVCAAWRNRRPRA